MHLTKALKSKVAEILIGPNTKENYTFHQHLGQRQLPLTQFKCIVVLSEKVWQP